MDKPPRLHKASLRELLNEIERRGALIAKDETQTPAIQTDALHMAQDAEHLLRCCRASGILDATEVG